jgi:sugar phosphate isomerase/epimerase
MRELGIDFISVLGMPPVDFIELAADLGCSFVSMAPAPITPNPYAFPKWSLLDDLKLRRATLVAMRARGVRLAVGEGFFVMPGVDMGDTVPKLDLMRELGATSINAVSMEPDQARAVDQLGKLMELATARGLKTSLEFVPVLAIATLPQALATIRQVGKPGLTVVIDAMHLVRGGSSPEDLAAVDPGLIGHAQICDAPREFTREGYAHEATCERRIPGQGDLPLVSIIKALPRHLPLGIEAPSHSAAQAGINVRTHMRQCVDATRRLLAHAERQ